MPFSQLGGVDRRGGVDHAHRRGDFLAVLVGQESHGVADHVHRAGLHHGVGIRADRIGQPVTTGDQDVADSAVTQVCDDVLPELGTLAVLNPDPQPVSAALQAHPDRQIGWW